MPTDGKRKKNTLKAKSKKKIVRAATPHNPDNDGSGIEQTPEIQEIEEMLLQKLKEAVHQQEI